MGLVAEYPLGGAPEQLSLELMCWLASIMLVLSCVIVLDAMRKWKSILSTPATVAVAPVITETA